MLSNDDFFNDDGSVKEIILKKIFDFYSDEYGRSLFKNGLLECTEDAIISILYQAILDNEELEKLREAGIDNNTKVINYCFSCGTKLNGG